MKDNLKIEILQKKYLKAKHKIEKLKSEKEFFQNALERSNFAIGLLRSHMGSDSWKMFQDDLSKSMSKLTQDLEQVVGVFKSLGLVVEQKHQEQEVPLSVQNDNLEHIEIKQSPDDLEPTDEEILSLEEDIKEESLTFVKKQNTARENYRKYMKSAFL